MSKKPKIKPLGDRVLIKAVDNSGEQTKGGIIIPDSAKEKPQEGTVIAVGEGTSDKPVTVKVGDKVLYGKYSGTEVTLEGAEYLICLLYTSDAADE